MTRIDRYQLAVMLAQEILQGPEAHDEFRIAQAAQDIADEVKAGRQNQRDMVEVNRRTLEQLERMGYSVKVVDTAPLRLVKEGDAA